jgi:hypothetical protein
VADTSVGTQVHQPLDIHRNFTAQIALDRECRNSCSQVRYLGFGKIFHGRLRFDTGCFTYLLRPGVPNSVYSRQRNHDVLVQRDIYACYTCHVGVP